MNLPAITLSDFDPQAFLRDTWQKKPLLVRGAFADWSNPVEPDELAGLACESGIESRLVHGAEGALSVEHGPLSAERFDALGTSAWTLLVQAVDHHVPEVAGLLDAFRFVPNWRIDDVMVSYATDGGGVGAHYDQYDVFLIQGLGRRRWELGDMCNDETPLLPHEDLRLLAQFTARQDFVLEPGDMLYVPPGLAHRGTAIGHDCMTYSVGFRAPSQGELVEGWTDAVLDTLAEDDRYADPDLTLQDNPGEITKAALGRLHAAAIAKLDDRQAFALWFGRLATAPKNDLIDWRPEETADARQVAAQLDDGAAILRNPASRFAFIRTGEDEVHLYVDGEGARCTGHAARFAAELCASPRLANVQANAEVTQLLVTLCNRGCVAFEED